MRHTSKASEVELLDILLAHELGESVYEFLIVVNGLLYLGELLEGLGYSFCNAVRA